MFIRSREISIVQFEKESLEIWEAYQVFGINGLCKCIKSKFNDAITIFIYLNCVRSALGLTFNAWSYSSKNS